ncbi:MAG: sporulation initiation factor Spo0A C-terminal domain-containing protein [Eubacterium sp.]|nr:sporulation initiation factor Spo0A C-terminal domain-containing protein [Eubacterium sp.]MDY5498060.1 sporulation initiation factor Spo0A C-terminal domain-containing protein [Anaerobutyricum sp.]
MNDVTVNFAGIFHVKDDLWEFVNNMDEHEKVIIFTVGNDRDFKKVFRIDTTGVQKLLLQIGIPANTLGFSYIVTAMELIAMNPEYLQNITKWLYVDIAKKCSSTPHRVERNIRTAISIGFTRGNLDLIEDIFGWSIRADKGIPTNSQFLANVYYYMINHEL